MVMRSHKRARRGRVVPWLVLGCLVALMLAGAEWAKAAKEFVPPRAYHAKTYPAREAHDNEKATVAVDPYDLPDKTAGVFSVPYKEHGFLPMQLLISNDGDTPIALADMKVELITVRRIKIPPATPEDIYRRIARQTRRGDEPQRNPFPVPLPRGKGKPSISKDAQDEIVNARFLARAVEPHSTQAGFVFFDVSGIDNPLAGAHLYVTGLRDSQGQELLYFEISLEKYLTYRPAH